MFLIAANFLISVLLFILWGIAGYLASRFAYSPSYGRLRLSAKALLIFIGLAELMVLAKVVLIIALGSQSWWFIQDKVLLQLPYLLIPAIAVAFLSIPKLWKISRNSNIAAKETLPDSERFLAFAPQLVLPIQLTALGAVFALGLTLFKPASPIHPALALEVMALFIVASGALWMIKQNRLKIMNMSEYFIIPRFGTRLLRSFVLFSIIIVCAASMYYVSKNSSVLPDHLNMMTGEMDYGGGSVLAGHDMGSMDGDMSSISNTGIKTVSLTNLTGPATGEPDRKFTLTAQKKTVTLSSGIKVNAWTFNGQLPGPELRIREGELVEVTLNNKDIEEGVTLHWHGLDVPNAEDGVSGLTQNAVMPGETHVYRFRAEQVGTFWYHSHQNSAEQVKKGLIGALIVEPKVKANDVINDIIAMVDSWDSQTGSVTALGSNDTLDRRAIQPNTPVKLHLINTGNWPHLFSLAGVKYKVAAIDGVDLNKPTDIENKKLEIAGGGRYDLTFIMPDHPVRLAINVPELNPNGAGLLLSPDGAGDVPALSDAPVFDPASYGSPQAAPFTLASHFDRKFLMVLDNKLGFYDGKPNVVFTINGRIFPDTPMFMVQEGDLVKTTFVNRSMIPHPMHLHGHHMLVLSHNGIPVTGSPWWTDSLNVNSGDTYEVGFLADNPGIWMDHCHNLEHAAVGMSMHLAYAGVTTPFEVGHATQNKPE
jgi:FtsP/CotA-like multicopper oxidase with cupredoxin domain